MVHKALKGLFSSFSDKAIKFSHCLTSGICIFLQENLFRYIRLPQMRFERPIRSEVPGAAVVSTTCLRKQPFQKL